MAKVGNVCGGCCMVGIWGVEYEAGCKGEKYR